MLYIIGLTKSYSLWLLDVRNLYAINSFSRFCIGCIRALFNEADGCT